MEVKLLNAEEAKNLLKNWGSVASVCYATDTDAPEKIGKHCMNSGHFSGSRGDFIKFLVTDVPRFTVDQAVRHEVGVFKNVQSFRYVSKDTFFYEVPVEITDSQEMLDKYTTFMNSSSSLYEEIQEYVYNKTQSHERANEQARYVLPMATHTSFVIGFTVEALIHFMNMRLCVRAEDTIHYLATLMKKATIEVLPELKYKLVPNCQALLWCPEGAKSCGAYPTKKELKDMVKEYKELKKNNGENA
jgi:thymidylate synthase (FAD)